MKAATRAEIPPFYVMEVMRNAAERETAGTEVLHLEVGQPSTPAPRGALDAAHQALESNLLAYSTALGIAPLRERIAKHYTDWYGAAVDAGDVAITVGASGACVLAFLACFDVGDRVAVMSPGYPCYRNMLQAFDVEVVDVAVDETTRFQPTPDLLAAHGPLDGVIVASPSNPTGTMLARSELDALLRFCSENDVRLISDEIYHGIGFPDRGSTAWRAGGTAIVINSFSKYFSMTGWRLGWMLLPEQLRAPVERLAQNLFIAAPTISQYAGLGAFESLEELADNVAVYRQNREILLEGLPRAGIDDLAPADGAFYIYARVDHLTADSQALCRQWLDELSLAVTPGIDFDPGRGHEFVRFSFAGSPDDMHEAVERLVAWRHRQP